MVFTVILRDITNRKRAEEKIAASLSEKEALLKEIHHRVKNNLQIISSLLKFQSRYVQDQEALGMLSESRNRIRSMALIHEKLYQSHNFARIDFAEYIRSLARSLFRSYGIDNAVALTIDADAMTLDIDRAAPCGLIITELLTNTLKYAFPAGQTGTINIRLRSKGEDHFTLVVGDSGIGLPEGFDLQKTPTLGMQLVALMAKQLQGTLVLDTSAGTTFVLTV
jgi:two-component sensor histidine kinase